MSQHFHIMYISRHTHRTTSPTNMTASQSPTTFLTTGCSKKTWTSLQALQGVYESCMTNPPTFSTLPNGLNMSPLYIPEATFVRQKGRANL